LRKAVELYPRSAVVWQQLGDVLRELGEREDGMTCYQKAMDLGFDGVDLRYSWDNVKRYGNSKREAIAIDHLQKENELLLLQLTQVQEMLEEYYLKSQELST